MLVPEGSRRKGSAPFLVQDLAMSAKATCYRRERWVTPDGRTVLEPLPGGMDGHFGPELRRFVGMQYYQGQSMMPSAAAENRLPSSDAHANRAKYNRDKPPKSPLHLYVRVAVTARRLVS